MNESVTIESRHKTVDSTPGDNDPPEGTKEHILRVATCEFAQRGFDGARIDAIAAASRTSKRMLYYYFKGKEDLYIAVLEAAYRRIREIESQLLLKDLDPVEALRTLVNFTYDFHLSNVDFVRLVMTENINDGAYLQKSKIVEQLNSSAIESVREILDRGVKQGLFRSGIDPIDLHASISGLAFYNVSNRRTFELLFKKDINSQESISTRRKNVVEMIVCFVLKIK